MIYLVPRNWMIPRTQEQIDRDYALTQREVHNKKNYKIKNHCFLCLIWFKNNWVHYWIYGNACVACCGRITRICSPSKQKNQSRLTSEEASFLLAERKIWVLKNHLNRPPSRRPKRFIFFHSPMEEIDRA